MQKGVLLIGGLAVVGLVLATRSSAAKELPAPAPSQPKPGPGPSPTPTPQPNPSPGPRTPKELEDVDPENYTDAEIGQVLADIKSTALGSSDFQEVWDRQQAWEYWASLLAHPESIKSQLDADWSAIDNRRRALITAKYNEVMGMPASSAKVNALLYWAPLIAEQGQDFWTYANNMTTKAAEVQERVERSAAAAQIRAECRRVVQQMSADGVDAATIESIRQDCENQARAVEQG